MTRLQVSKHPRVAQQRLCHNGAPLPSTGSTASGVPRRHRYYQSPKTSGVENGVTYGFAPPFPLRFSTFAPTRRRFPRRPGPTLSRGTLGYFKVGRSPDLPGSWKIHPLPLPRSRTPVSPDPLAMTASPMQSPPMGRRRHQRCGNFEALSRGFGIRCLRFTSMSPCPMQGSLPAGGSPVPGGSRTHWISSKGFSYLHNLLPSQTWPGATQICPHFRSEASTYLWTPLDRPRGQ